MSTRVPAVERAARVLEFLAQRPHVPQTAAQISAALGIHRATAHATATALTELDLLTRDEQTKTYSLGPGAVSIGAGAIDRYPGARAAREEMHRLARELDLSCLVCVRVDDDMVALDHVGSDELPSRPRVRDGERYPLRPPAGTVFWAWEPEEAIEAWLARTVPEATDAELAVYRDTLATVRERGYSHGAESEVELDGIELVHRLERASTERERARLAQALAAVLRAGGSGQTGDVRRVGVNYVIAPIFGLVGEVVMALTLYGRPGQLTVANAQRYAAPLLAATRAVTSSIGGTTPGTQRAAA
jgi:DNA-binding IclR family transcriptional regulator